MRLLDDERGQSVQVGAAILLGFVVIAITIYQVQVVSSQNAEVEFNHNQEARQDMTELRNAIHNAGTTGTSTAVSVNLGTQYPPRSIFLNPPPPRGILRTESIGTISISNATVAEDPGVDYTTDGDTPQQILNGTHETSRIAYTPDYAEFDGTPTTVVEHSLGFNAFDNNVSDPITPQGVVNGDAITLAVLRGNVSEQGSSAASIAPRTVTATDEIDIKSQGGPITLDLPTDTPAVWNETLGETFDTGEPDARVASWNPATDTIRVALDRSEYTFQIAMVGVGNGVPLSDRYDVKRTGGSGNGASGAYSLDWTDPSQETANTDDVFGSCNEDQCTWDAGENDDTLRLNATTYPSFPGLNLEFALSNTDVLSLSSNSGKTGDDGAETVDIVAEENGTVDILALSNDGSDIIQIDVTGVESDPGPSGSFVFDDANQNRQYDNGETTYSKSDLEDGFQDTSVDLVIPSDVGTMTSDGISIRANSIISESNFETTNGNLVLEATGGQLDVRNLQITTQNGDPSLIADGDLLFDGAEIDGGQTLLDGGYVSVEGSAITANNAQLSIDSGSTIDASGASLTSTTNDVSLQSGDDIFLQDSSISATNGGASVGLGGGNDAVYVDGMTIDDRDDNLAVSPGGADVIGTPESGTAG